MRVMAIDYGTRAIGVAISDELQITSRPLLTLRRGKAEWKPLDQICDLVREHEIGLLLVGLPLRMDGTRGDAAQRVERLIDVLRERLSLPVVGVDERLTSREADAILRERGIGLRERQERSDELAAAIILQQYLDTTSSP
jgi:putative holliday junction resolvase